MLYLMAFRGKKEIRWSLELRFLLVDETLTVYGHGLGFGDLGSGAWSLGKYLSWFAGWSAFVTVDYFWPLKAVMPVLTARPGRELSTTWVGGSERESDVCGRLLKPGSKSEEALMTLCYFAPGDSFKCDFGKYGTTSIFSASPRGPIRRLRQSRCELTMAWICKAPSTY